MERVVVTVKRKGEARVRDLEVPSGIGSAKLAELIAHTLRWESNSAGQPLLYAVEAEPPGRLLGPGESLADAGVWDGSWLVLHPITPAPASAPFVADAAPVSPVTGWQPLGVTLPPTADGELPAEQAKHNNGFVWKRVDQ